MKPNRTASIVLGLSSLLTHPAIAQPQFSDPNFLSIRNGFPEKMVAGDFNGDGYSDFFVADSRIRSLLLIASDGKGGFGPAKIVAPSFGSSAVPATLETCDLNEDGILDVAARIDTRGIKILLAIGTTGAFRLALSIDSTGPFIVHDFDQDGHQDLVWLDQRIEVKVLYGNGRGEFTREETYSVPDNRLAAVQFDFADFSRDGQSEMILITQSVFGFGPVQVLRLIGTAFQETQRVSGIRGARHLVIEDLNGDLVPDVAVSSANGVALLFGDENGSVVGGPSFPTPGNVDVVADIDRDGNLDLVGPVVLSSDGVGNGEVSILLGDGRGGFSETVPFSAGNSADSVVVGNFAGSCGLDIATLSALSSNLAVLFNRTTGLTPDFRGRVNSGRGQTVDVLFLNGSPGSGPERRVEYNVLGRFEITIQKPPAVPINEAAPFAAYVWIGRISSPTQAQLLPYGIGCSHLPMPISGGDPQPDVIWNNLGRFQKLGTPNRGSAPAPTILFSRPVGRLSRVNDFIIQGIIYDPGSRADIPVSLTNGITAVPVFGR